MKHMAARACLPACLLARGRQRGSSVDKHGSIIDANYTIKTRGLFFSFFCASGLCIQTPQQFKQC